jgi:hypothetical protein
MFAGETFDEDIFRIFYGSSSSYCYYYQKLEFEHSIIYSNSNYLYLLIINSTSLNECICFLSPPSNKKITRSQDWNINKLKTEYIQQEQKHYA